MIDKRVLLAVLAACGGGNGGGGNEVTVEIHRGFPFVDGDTADEAEFVAVQDGDGAFIQASGVNGVFTVPIASDKFGVAVGCVDEASGFVDIEIVQRTVAEDLVYQTACKFRPTTGSIEITVVGLVDGQRLRLRTARNITQAIADGPITMDVDEGDNELIGTLSDANRNVIKLFRIPSIQVAPTAAVTLNVVADGAAPDSGTFTIDPDDPNATIRTAIVRPYGSVSLTGLTNPIGTSRNYLKVPGAIAQPDDLFRFTVNGSNGDTASRTEKSPGTLAFALPQPFTAGGSELLEAPFVHPVWTFDPTPATLENQSYFLDASNFSDFNAVTFRDWFVTISAGWIGDQTTLRYEFPDFSGMPGFANVALVANERLDTNIERIENTGDFDVDGSQSTSSTVSGVVGKFCGDGTVIAPEVCDPGDGFETATCDSDCTPVECGDNVVNFTANEECDPPDGTTCSPECKAL